MGATIPAGIWRTLDGGHTIVSADGGIDKTGYSNPTPVRKCPANDNVFVAGTAKLFRTENFFDSNAPTWTYNGPSDSLGTDGQIFAVTFLASDANCGTYAYGASIGQIRITRDAGKTWRDLDPAPRKLPVRAINSIAFDPASPDTMYLALSSFNPAPPGKSGHIFKATNASSGAPSWANVGPAADVPFNIVVVDPRDSHLVYAGSDAGLWVSGDAGTTWQKAGPERGLPNVEIDDIEINATTNLTVVFTHGRGAYQLVK
jgi:photosystem II stability/assembly factor-like uncharacterized protein